MEADARILLLDSAGRAGCVGLATARGVVAATHLPGEMRHAAELMPAVDDLLRGQGWPAESLTDVFLTIGPGSFTGLRLGVAIARTLAWSVGVRIVAVPTLDVLAMNALTLEPPAEHVAVLLDAKRGQVYAAAFRLEGGWYRAVIDACLEEPAVFLARCPRPLAVLGEGIPAHRQAVHDSAAAVLDPRYWPGQAENVFALGRERLAAGGYTLAGELLPFYIRRPEAEEKWEKRHGIQPSTSTQPTRP